MQSIDHIVHAKWIVTGEKNQRVLENHSMLINSGIIIDILPTSVVKEKYQANCVSEYPQHAIMAGFINAHTHIGMNYFRGLGSDLALMDWLTQYIWPAEKKWLADEFVHDASLFAMAEMIRSGTTCFNDMFYFLQATARAAETAGIRAFIGMTVIEFPTAWAQTTDEYFDKGIDFYEQYKNNTLITPTFAPHAPYTVSDQSFMRIKELADSFNLKINLHLHETNVEIEQSLTEFKKRPIKRLHDLGLLSPQLLAIHATQLNEEDLDILAQTKTHIIHCPESNMKLASGICPVEKLQSLGVNVALGTDSVASNNDLDMISEMRTATFLSKVSTMSPVSLNADETLALATLNGAKALGIDHMVGSLSKGKTADFIAIHLDEIETLPIYDPVIQLVYSCGRQQVSDVWVAGKQLMKNRELLTLNEREIVEKARFWGQKIRG
ncbi:MAG: TRZ/ATZ family hydrolase [Legionellaceae bacterium]|nr:TRZ/ATZ family hydrolase [Legionellaceae bacterium]